MDQFGNTAPHEPQTPTPSAIPTQGETDMFKSFFERASNAIVEASNLATALPSLRAEVEALKADIHAVREHNATLDEALTYTRRQRDEANAKLNEIGDMNNRLQHSLDEASAHRTAYENDNAVLKSELDQARRDRDLYFQDAVQTGDEVERLKATLAEVHAKLGALFPPEPTPVEPTPPAPTPGYAQSIDPQPVQVPAYIRDPVEPSIAPTPADPEDFSGESWWERDERMKREAEHSTKAEDWQPDHVREGRPVY